MIQCNNANIGHKQALFNTGNLHLKKGQLISLIGPNGSGKTTFFESILGQVAVLSGEILIDSVKSDQMDRNFKMTTFGHVSSRFSGIEHLTIYDLIALGRAPYTNFLNRLSTDDHQLVKQIIEQLNIQHIAAKSTMAVSDGERQIAMIGKALAQESKVLILDEPNAFLDYNNKRKIMELLKDLAENRSLLVLLSSHDLDLSMQYSHGIIAIDQSMKTIQRFSPAYSKEEIIKRVF